MKRNNLKVLATCLSIVTSFVFFGCARQDMAGTMDKNMGAAKEEVMDTMQGKAMKSDMNTMNEQNMEKPVKEMTDQNMGGMKDEKQMNPEKETMMK